MKIRIKFLLGKQKEFLLEVAKRSNLSTDELAKLAGIVPRSYRDWKREKLNINLEAAEFFSNKFGVILPEKKELMIERWLNLKKEISKKGGLALFKKHGNPATPEGRRKGGAKTLSILRAKGIIPGIKRYDLPSRYTEDLAEYVGILLGDGGITPGQVCVTLNGEADKDYVKFVADLKTYLFGTKPRILQRKDSKAIEIYLNGIQLVGYLTSIGLKIGNKVKQQVDVPIWIKASKSYKMACLRGLMDTDGGVFLHRYKVNGKVYIYKKICFSNHSLPLLYFVAQALKDLGLTPKMITKIENKKVWLYNKEEVECYLSLVGTHNSRLLKYQNGFSNGRVVSNGKTQVC